MSSKNQDDIIKFLKEADIDVEEFDLGKYIKGKNEDIANKQYFDAERSGYVEAFLAKMVDKELIKDFDDFDKIDDPTANSIIELSRKAVPLSLDDESGEVVYYVDGEKKILEFREMQVPDLSRLADLIDDVPYDVTQSGIIERAKESESIYRVCVLNKVYNGAFTKYIKDAMRGYDFEKLKGDLLFADVEKKIIEATPNVSRLIVQICNFKLTNVKTKKEQRFERSLFTAEDLDLRALKLSISAIINDFESVIKSKETKAQREVARENAEENRGRN
jgi:hypothetical protein